MIRFLALALLLPSIAFGGAPVEVCDGTGCSTLTGRALPVAFNTANKWTCSLTGLAATLTQCKALSSGRTYYITDIVVQTTTTTSGQFAIQSGTGLNCAAATTAVFPSSDASHRYNAPISTSPIAAISFVTPLAVTEAHAVCVIGTATNTISITLSGFYTP